MGAIPTLTVDVDTESAAKAETLRVVAGNAAAVTRRVRSWYAHMVLIHLSEFGAEAARGLVLPTLFTYVQELGGGLEDIGLLTALFSVGRFFSSLLFGWLCDRTSFRVLYNVAGVCAVVGNVLYVLPYSTSVRSRTVLALSRFVIGFGAGNRSVCRANIAMLTRVDQRLQYFTLFATVVFLAYALTPGLGSVVGDTQVDVAGDLLQFNRFTAPGFLLVALNLLTIVFNNLIYDDSVSRDDAPAASPTPASAATCSSPASTESKEKVRAINDSDAAIDKEKTSQAPQRHVAQALLSDRAVVVGMLVFIFLNFNARGILSIFETVNVPLFLEMTNRSTAAEQDSVEATKEASSFYLVVGLLGLLSYGSVQVLRKKVSDVGFLFFGFAMLLVGNAILLALCADMHVNNERSDDVDEEHTQQQFNIFVAAEVFVWSVGCPLTSAVVVSAFSKVLGSRPQGLLMGVFGASASVARMVLPFLPSLLASWPLLFLVNMVLCALCVVVLSMYLGIISNRSDGPSTVTYDSVQLHSDGQEQATGAVSSMELKVTPICGRDYRVLERLGVVLSKASLGGSLPPSRGICWNPLTRCLLVCDVVQCCVHSYSASFSPDAAGEMKMSLSSTQSVGTLGSQDSAPDQLRHPVAVAVNLRGEVAVADGKLNRVQVFSGSGGLAHVFGRTGSARGEFKGIRDLQFTPRGAIAIVDSGNHRIQVMTATGVVVHVVGRYGWKLGELVNPCALAVNGKGAMFVCDEGNKRIQRFSDTGRPVLEWGSRRGPSPDLATIATAQNEVDNTELHPVAYSIFDTPCDIAMGIHDEVIVSDSGRREILIFSDIGACLHIVNAPNLFQSSYPTAIALCLNTLVVVSKFQLVKHAKISQSEDVQAAEIDNCLFTAFPPGERVRVGRFESMPVHCAVATVCYLAYDDVLHLRLVSHYFHQVCRDLRNEWRLYPLIPGQASVVKYSRIVSPATGLVAVEEAFQKWGLRIHKPSHRTRKHVMDFQGGFCSAVSTLYGPLFCYQHEDVLRSFFSFYAAASLDSTDKEEIEKAAFVEIVTQVEEVRAGYRTWEQCTPFARAKSQSQQVSLPTIRAVDNIPSASRGVPLPTSLRLVENAQEHQLSKLLQKLQAL
ncbi:hypothetical protein PHYPSEUDO_014696 [Phytophthora pseudosyringae]|uniref:Major facilitator superfamily (MFS) profile domain-containing protein n=1 Tax=Phytophthora pseudosyringae TaxID=221518 RepID=A0A8T1V4Z3_9STRA|nr:hypothetical protein PHYPSEUDO_014696 [Phytophthora pseudosyringae]